MSQEIRRVDPGASAKLFGTADDMSVSTSGVALARGTSVENAKKGLWSSRWSPSTQVSWSVDWPEGSGSYFGRLLGKETSPAESRSYNWSIDLVAVTPPDIDHQDPRTQRSSSGENRANDARLEQFNSYWTPRLMSALRAHPIEPGEAGPADVILAEAVQRNALAAMHWINGLLLTNISSPSVAAGLVMLVGRLPYAVANPVGVTMAVAALTQKSPQVQEAGIRAFEAWNAPDALQVLRATQVAPKWLSSYLAAVIADLETCRI